jgi:hypothetical protein
VELVTGGICDTFEASEEGFTAAAAVAYCLVGREMEYIHSEQIRGCLDDPVRTKLELCIYSHHQPQLKYIRIKNTAALLPLLDADISSSLNPNLAPCFFLSSPKLHRLLNFLGC